MLRKVAFRRKDAADAPQGETPAGDVSEKRRRPGWTLPAVSQQI